MFDLQNIHFHHTGVITENIQVSKAIYEKLGYKASNIFEDKAQESYIVILSKINSSTIELVSPINENSISFGWLKRISGGAYHICFEIKDVSLAEGINYFKSLHFTLISEPSISPAFNGKNVIFLWNKEAGLIELLGDL